MEGGAWQATDHGVAKELDMTEQQQILYICDLYSATHHLGEGSGTPLQHSCLENPMDREAWWAVVHGAAKSQTRLSDFAFTFHFHALEKEMATHSSVLAWRIPGTGEPGGLPSMGLNRVGLKRLSSSTHLYLSQSSNRAACVMSLPKTLQCLLM